jgi:D-alanyl-D-alanine carboxypeptidase
MTVQFRSLVKGGFFSKEPFDKSVPVSIRTNNPGAINTALWIREYPGYVGDKLTSYSGYAPNRTVIFETPEHGVAAWWELMRKYTSTGATTLGQIITRYGGGQNYTPYVNAVTKWTGIPAGKVIDLHKDDRTLLAFAKGMFRYESGVQTPLSDKQIVYGFHLGRNGGKPLCEASEKAVDALFQAPPTPETPHMCQGSFWQAFLGLFR